MLARAGDPASAARPDGFPQLDLRVERQGSRSFLASRFATYPFHLTRTFRLDAACPQVATLYLQSSSGGLYAGEDLAMRIRVGRGAALHLTTQGSTIVHGDRGRTARMRIRIDVEDGAFFAFTPDPQILFPGAASDTRLELHLASAAVAVLSDGCLLHDPAANNAPPVSYASTTEVIRDRQTVFVDRQRVKGFDMADPQGPLRGYPICASALLLGLGTRLPPDHLEAALDLPGILRGATSLPEGCGIGGRLLAADGAAYTRGATAVFEAAFSAHFGIAPAPRRK